MNYKILTQRISAVNLYGTNSMVILGIKKADY